MYTVCFLAHSSSGGTLEDNIFTFPDLGDIFFVQEDFEVGAEEDSTLSILLHRIVSKVEFVAKDDVPEAVTDFTIEASAVFDRLDLLTGTIIKEGAPQTFTHHFTAEERSPGVKNMHSFFTFVPEETQIGQIVLTALTETKEVVRSRVIQSVPIEENRIIRYAGVLYTPGFSDYTFDLSIYNEGVWSDPKEIELPD